MLGFGPDTTRIYLYWIFLLDFLTIVSLVSSQDLRKEIPLPPRIIKGPESKIVRQKQPVRLECEIEPANAKVFWLREGVRLSPSRDVAIHGKTLFISKYRNAEHEGIYQCGATTKAGTVVSSPASITAAVLGRFPRQEDEQVSVAAGNTAVLPCRIHRSMPPARMSFEVNGTIIDRETERYHILSWGDLHIANARKEDSGDYRCHAENPVSLKTREANHVIHLTVIDPGSPTPPVFSRAHGVHPPTDARDFELHYEAATGDEVTLECAATGNPPPQVTWPYRVTSPGKKPEGIPTVATRQILGNLILSHVTPNDSGLYTCRAENGVGAALMRVVKLTVNEPPSARVHPRIVMAEVGETVRVRCESSGVPQPRPQWRMSRVPVLDNQHLTIKKNELIIRDVQPYHTGVYQCFASNKIGTAQDSTYIFVQSDKPTSPPPSPFDELGYSTTNMDGSKKKNRRRKCKGRGRRGKNCRRRGGKKQSDLAIPSIPEVTVVTPSSVRIRWSYNQSAVEPAKFFKVQYHEVKARRGSSSSKVWSTPEEEIPANATGISQHLVAKLKPGASYVFRMAGFYSDGKTEVGASGARVTMAITPTHRETRPHVQELLEAPVILQALPTGPTTMRIRWRFISGARPALSGFMLEYWEYQQYDTIQRKRLRHHRNSAVVTGLKPRVSYSFKLEAFDETRQSSSNIVTQAMNWDVSDVGDRRRTKDPGTSEPVEPTPGPDGETRETPRPNVPGQKPPRTTSLPPPRDAGSTDDGGEAEKKKTGSRESDLLYMVLGVVLGVLMLLLVIVMLTCGWRHRRKTKANRRAAAGGDLHGPEATALKCRTNGFAFHAMNGGIHQNGGPPGLHQSNHFNSMHLTINPVPPPDDLDSDEPKPEIQSSASSHSTTPSTQLVGGCGMDSAPHTPVSSIGPEGYRPFAPPSDPGRGSPVPEEQPPAPLRRSFQHSYSEQIPQYNSFRRGTCGVRTSPYANPTHMPPPSNFALPPGHMATFGGRDHIPRSHELPQQGGRGSGERSSSSGRRRRRQKRRDHSAEDLPPPAYGSLSRR